MGYTPNPGQQGGGIFHVREPNYLVMMKILRAEVTQLYEVNCAFNRKSHLGVGWNIIVINYICFYQRYHLIRWIYMPKSA